jgi:starch phosphorylase
MDDKNSVAQWMKIDGLDLLAELAFNLHWSWNHESDELWRQLDAGLWENTQNPWLILQTVSRARLQAALSNPAFRGVVDSLLSKHRTSYQQPAWPS